MQNQNQLMSICLVDMLSCCLVGLCCELIRTVANFNAPRELLLWLGSLLIAKEEKDAGSKRERGNKECFCIQVGTKSESSLMNF